MLIQCKHLSSASTYSSKESSQQPVTLMYVLPLPPHHPLPFLYKMGMIERREKEIECIRENEMFGRKGKRDEKKYFTFFFLMLILHYGSTFFFHRCITKERKDIEMRI